MPDVKSDNGYYLWHYNPSQPAAVVFIVLFALATAAHGWKMFTTRMWFCLPFFIGGICTHRFFPMTIQICRVDANLTVVEIIGYMGRILSHDHTDELGPYIIQSIFLLLAPVLFAASLYMTYGRCVRAIDGHECSPSSALWTTRLFILGDCFSFLVQGAGAGMLAKGGDPTVPRDIVLVGLIIQVLMFGVFICVAVRFNIQYRKKGRAERFLDVPWQASLTMLYITSVAVMVRNIFRVAQYAAGNDAYLMATEWPVYVFDGVLMLFTMASFFWWYPSQLRSLQRGSMTELTGTVESGDDQSYKR